MTDIPGSSTLENPPWKKGENGIRLWETEKHLRKLKSRVRLTAPKVEIEW
jgi:hypothetical protein